MKHQLAKLSRENMISSLFWRGELGGGGVVREAAL